MKSIKDSTAYLKKRLLELLPLIKQLLCLGLSLTLTCANMHWEELPKATARRNSHPVIFY